LLPEAVADQHSPATLRGVIAGQEASLERPDAEQRKEVR
jgi:hypothetical protein